MPYKDKKRALEHARERHRVRVQTDTKYKQGKLESGRKYRQNHREECRAQVADYRRRNRSKILSRQKENYYKNWSQNKAKARVLARWRRERMTEEEKRADRVYDRAQYAKHREARLQRGRLRYAWLRSQPDFKSYIREKNLKIYGLTLVTFNALLKKQNKRCALCLRKIGTVLHVDHHPKLGRKAVRGLLCFPCNANVVGKIDNSPGFLERVTEYMSARNKFHIHFPDASTWKSSIRRCNFCGKSIKQAEDGIWVVIVA